MRLQDLNWMDVERYLEHDNRIILVTGATEQHAYLSLLTAVLIPSRIADAVAEREKVIVAPPLNFGVSQMFAEYPGTISLSRQTFELAVLEIVESLLHQGFRRFFIFNGHNGNVLPARLQDFQEEGVIRVVWYNWWESPAVQDFEAKYQLTLEHANWGENFPFNRVADSPREAKSPVTLEFTDYWQSVRDILGDGSFGGPYQIGDELMLELLMAVVDDAAARLRTIHE